MKTLSKTQILRQIKRIPYLSKKWKALILTIVIINLLVLFITLSFSNYRSLLVLFYYSALCISPFGWFIPMQEPMLMMYGSLYPAFIVAVFAGVATFMVEIINYQMMVPICNIGQLKRFKQKRFYLILEKYFNKMPFFVIAFVGFTPVPHVPFRILSVLANYSIVRYSISTAIGRGLFYYLIALSGMVLNIPYWFYIIVIIAASFVTLSLRIARSHAKASGQQD